MKRYDNYHDVIENVDDVLDDRYVRLALLAMGWIGYIQGIGDVMEDEVPPYEALVDREYDQIAEYAKNDGGTYISRVLLAYTVLKAQYPNTRLVISEESDNIYVIREVPLSYERNDSDICSGDDIARVMGEDFAEYSGSDIPITSDPDVMVEEVPGLEEYIDDLIKEDEDIPFQIFTIFERDTLDHSLEEWLSTSLSLWKVKPWLDRIMRDLPPYGCIRRRSPPGMDWRSDINVFFQ